MDLELAGQTAVVIGGAKGIGAAIAGAFAAEQANVVVVDIDPAVEQAAAEIAGTFGIRADGIVGDATMFASVQQVAKKVVGEFASGVHLVYAAGVGSGKYGFPFWNLLPNDWPRVIDVNLIGAVNVAHAFAPGLTEAKCGTMTFLSSIAGQIGSQTDPPYSAAKAALINFMQCAAKDLAPFHVRANAISPGMVKTTVNRAVWQSWHDRQPEAARLSYEEWADDKVKRVAPLARWQTAEDIAAAAVFLASAKAGNITGQTINVDGGQVMHA